MDYANKEWLRPDEEEQRGVMRILTALQLVGAATIGCGVVGVIYFFTVVLFA